jgi:hypothetical protein
VFAHFGSEEELQLATVQWAREVFIAEVVEPARRVPAGLRRLWRLCNGWLDCRVRDAIAAAHRDWQRYLERSVAAARDLGELAADTDPRQLAFELDAFTRATQDALLFDERGVYTRARRAMLHRLRAAAVNPDVLPKAPR